MYFSINQMQESGLFTKWHNTFCPNQDTCGNQGQFQKPVDIADMKGILLLTAALVGFSILVFVGELIYDKITKRHLNTTSTDRVNSHNPNRVT